MYLKFLLPVKPHGYVQVHVSFDLMLSVSICDGLAACGSRLARLLMKLIDKFSNMRHFKYLDHISTLEALAEIDIF